MRLVMQLTVAIITVSDRASAGQYEDRSGPALKAFAVGRGWQAAVTVVVPDEIPAIQSAIRRQAEAGCALILTTGGTGAALRDVTPEAVRAIAGRELPGFGERMRAESLKLTPHAILSRSLAAVVGQSLVICLPGSPRGAVECLEFVVEAVPHCVQLLRGENAH